MREEVAAAREAIDSLIAEQLHLQLDSFAERADRLVAASKPSEAPKPDTTLDDPHELRIAGKALRYTLEMAEIEGHDLPKKIMKGFKQMQESLGLWHDYVVLSERVMQVSLEALLPHHNAPLQAQMLDLAKNLLGRSTKHLTEFAALWSSRGQELSAGIRHCFPLSRPVTAPAVAPADSPTAPPRDDAPVIAPQMNCAGHRTANGSRSAWLSRKLGPGSACSRRCFNRARVIRSLCEWSVQTTVMPAAAAPVHRDAASRRSGRDPPCADGISEHLAAGTGADGGSPHRSV